MGRLSTKTAIVTGGASGFGEGIVRKFISEGARVAIADINANAAQQLADELGEQASAYGSNVSVADDVKRLIADVHSKLGAIDIMVNNAGITHKPTPMEDISEEDFDRVFSVNAKSVFLTSKYVVPLMKANGSGVILNVASTGGVSPRPNLSWYNATKGWMITATKTMAFE